MTRLRVTVMVAMSLGSVACSLFGTPPSTKKVNGCTTLVELHRNGSALFVLDPQRLVCAPDDMIGISFKNADSVQHDFLILEMGCSGIKGGSQHPTVGLIGRPTKVPAGQTLPLMGSPKMLPASAIKALQCGGTAPFLFSYTIRVSGVPKDKDPDLEVSPPPAL